MASNRYSVIRNPNLVWIVAYIFITASLFNCLDKSGKVNKPMSIRETLERTKQATWAIYLPSRDPKLKGLPLPVGTGFVTSPDGWFVTAAHVVTENNKSDGPIRNDISKASLWKERPPFGDKFWVQPVLGAVSFEYLEPRTDFALLKVDFEANKDKDFLKEKTEFPYIEVSSRQLDEGESVYSFGYPLPSLFAETPGDEKSSPMIASISLCPRVTSAIVSSTLEKTEMVMTSGDPRQYVLDKALNYGNSGGPIVATETGKVHAFCSRFQPVSIPQEHLQDKEGKKLSIVIPSLYGIVSSLANPTILAKLKEVGVPIVKD